MSGKRPRAFKTPADFRRWLERHHAAARELVLKLYKVHALDRGIGYAQAVDEALCFGWIDGVRHALDADSFTVRFSPRKPKSYWSAVNLRHARRLIDAGRMRPPGRAAFGARPKQGAPDRYSFEAKPAVLDPAFMKAFRAAPEAWAYYAAQPPWYRRVTTHWVMIAKRPETRERRFRTLLERSAQRLPIRGLERGKASG